MYAMSSMPCPSPRALGLFLLLALPFAACGGDDSPTQPPALVLSVSGPIVAFEGSGVDCAAFPVRVGSPSSEGGTLDALEVTALRTGDSTELATNRRPNEDHTFPDTTIPPGGLLEVEGAVCWPPQPAGTGLAVRVTAEPSPRNQRPSVQVPVTGPRD